MVLGLCRLFEQLDETSECSSNVQSEAKRIAVREAAVTLKRIVDQCELV
jgi:hypothetical protein